MSDKVPTAIDSSTLVLKPHMDRHEIEQTAQIGVVALLPTFMYALATHSHFFLLVPVAVVVGAIFLLVFYLHHAEVRCDHLTLQYRGWRVWQIAPRERIVCLLKVSVTSTKSPRPNLFLVVAGKPDKPLLSFPLKLYPTETAERIAKIMQLPLREVEGERSLSDIQSLAKIEGR